MPAMTAQAASVLQPQAKTPNPDAPPCILAALIDGLTSPERYSLEVRDGELFIDLARGPCGC